VVYACFINAFTNFVPSKTSHLLPFLQKQT
jgi:hypothetical protein